jgi:hypothetical protein
MRMPSGAMHDAQVMARLVETGMIFIPSRGGRSHCPEEYSEPGQVEQGTNVLLDAIGVLAGQAPLSRITAVAQEEQFKIVQRPVSSCHYPTRGNTLTQARSQESVRRSPGRSSRSPGAP